VRSPFFSSPITEHVNSADPLDYNYAQDACIDAICVLLENITLADEKVVTDDRNGIGMNPSLSSSLEDSLPRLRMPLIAQTSMVRAQN
jgi:hypothetical protein